MTECKSINTPMEVGFQIDNTCEDIIDVPYRELIGALMYLSTTARPDLQFSVSYLSRMLNKPTEKVWKAAKRVLRYLQNTKDLGLVYRKGNELLNGYSDADWATDKSDRKSISGSVIFHGNNAVHWFSKKQSCVALSTAEAEYISGATTAQELVNLKGILSDFNINNQVILFCDNQSAIQMCKSYENSKRSKHIDIRTHFIKDLLSKNVLDIKYVTSVENIADIFTKALTKDSFVKFRNMLNII